MRMGQKPRGAERGALVQVAMAHARRSVHKRLDLRCESIEDGGGAEPCRAAGEQAMLGAAHPVARR